MRFDIDVVPSEEKSGWINPRLGDQSKLIDTQDWLCHST
jgi:hypothetical protein